MQTAGPVKRAFHAMPSRSSKHTTSTLRDVARESGFSPATVSIVLNEAPLARYIPPHTKERIEKAARRLGYRPNQLARSLRSSRNHTLGVMVFDITDPYCTPIVRGIENSLYQASFVPILADAHNDRGRFEKYLEMLLERRVEGLVVVANWMLVDINLLADMEKRNIPTVIIGRELQRGSISSVLVDNEAGGKLALQHLHSLGHRKIAFIRGPKMLADSGSRWKGLRAFARSAGMKIDEHLVCELPDLREPNAGFEGGVKATEEFLRRKRPFTAIMAFDDMTALGCIRALTKARIKVPEQCSIIGFDDVAPAAFSTPALTTIRQPMEAMGTTAVEIVVESIRAAIERRDGNVTHRKVAPELVARESTRAIG
jgi:LacI family transcriptional regulator, galactose operon repressor